MFNAKSKKAGYQQVSYKWNDDTYTYESRWHTETPGAAQYGRGTTWVVTRRIPGNAKGVMSILEYKIGGVWIDIEIWKAAERANIAGVATEEQMRILEAGHWLAK